MIKERPICQEQRWNDGNPCLNPVRYVVDAPAGITFVCGIHARMYRATVLYPFRLHEWTGKKFSSMPSRNQLAFTRSYPIQRKKWLKEYLCISQPIKEG